eukprot:CAMPEP_0201674298 /NCGR_PEP_ID=MMETSP0494-20130426/36710_1 /ASSEMBLY_ACC=CAM_ASM_000839 /TAXON_ID=420259 /ORGANISM="Thalassiosira gravida, Strain GMp14c1" /LENGTH=49 /DNA_ID= /DNA_START= /DNA_END= /DNA_ORIENTATION=
MGGASSFVSSSSTRTEFPSRLNLASAPAATSPPTARSSSSSSSISSWGA